MIDEISGKDELSSGKKKWLENRARREEEQKNLKQKKTIKRIFKTALIVLIIGVGIAGLGWYFKIRPPLPESEIISRAGIHWHPEIKISILGQKQEIPDNIGLGVVEKPIHTHDNTGVIHLEFSGLVKKDDILLGKFFEVWGKKFSKDCIFDKCNGFEGQIKMLINGKQNFEFENYLMKDKDKIEIIFE